MALERFSLALKPKSHVDKEGEGRPVLTLFSLIINPEFGVELAFRKLVAQCRSRWQFSINQVW